MQLASRLGKKLIASTIKEPFTAREILRRKWPGLTDSKLVEEIMKYFGFGHESKGFNMPFDKETKEEVAEESPPLSKEVLAEFRGPAARANH